MWKFWKSLGKKEADLAVRQSESVRQSNTIHGSVSGSIVQNVAGNANKVSMQGNQNQAQSSLEPADVARLIGEMMSQVSSFDRPELSASAKDEALTRLNLAQKATEKEEVNKNNVLNDLNQVMDCVKSAQGLYDLLKPIYDQMMPWFVN